VLAKVAGPRVRLVDSAEAVAEAVAASLAESGLARPAAAGPEPALRVCVTDAGEGFRSLARRILGAPELNLEWVEVV